MEDRVKLLIETAGCNQYEAELALKSAKGNFADALDFLNRVSPGLGILKCKFYLTDKYIYGVFLIIRDIKQKSILSVSSVVSANPAVFEYDIDKSWEEIDKTIFIYRMENGVYAEYSNQLQEKLYKIAKTADLMHDQKKSEEIIKTALYECCSSDNIVLNLNFEEEPYKTHRSDIQLGAPPDISQGEKIILDVELLNDDEGYPAATLCVGDVVWARIIDQRDIAEYLSIRLGGRSSNKIQPLAVQITGSQKNGDTIVLNFRFTEKIEGKAEMESATKVKVASKLGSRGLLDWIKKIIK